MKKIPYYFYVLLLIPILIGCNKDGSSSPSLDEDMIGFWFKLTSENKIAMDLNGYFWGMQIERNGEVTIARLDYNNNLLNTDADGSVFQITKAKDGEFTGTGDGETISGTYQMGTVSNAGYDYHQMGLYSAHITDYLPGGTGGDWSITGKYIKLYNADFKDAAIGETPITDPPEAPTNLTFDRVANGGTVTLEWNDNSEIESAFEIERRLFETGDYSKLATVNANATTYNDNTVEAAEVYQYRVRAINNNGNSGYTNVVIVKGIPKTPWDLTSSHNVSTNAAIFEWWARYSDDIDHFQFALWSDGAWSDLGFTFASNPTNVTNNQWKQSGTMNYRGGEPWPPATYIFAVKAVNSEGESSYSEQTELVITGKKSSPIVLEYLQISY